MIVALDSTPLTVETGGIRRYVEELHRALEREYPRDRFVLMSDQDRELAGAARRWWTVGVRYAIKQNRVDLFHGTDFAVPYLGGVPAVMTVHDLSPWKYPDQTSPRVRRRTPWLLRLRRAQRVITPSEAIRRAVIERFGLKPDHVHAIPLGVSDAFRPVEAPKPARPYFLAVGTMEGRKNLASIIEAHKAVAASADLLIAGREGSAGEFDAGRARFLGAVPEADLPALYSNAAALLFPSLYEGFGLPMIEAMACGCPVIASRDPALRETSGGAAIHVEALDTAGWVEAMRGAVSGGVAESRRAAAIARAQEFTWRRTAVRTREVYASVLAEGA